MAPGVKSWIQGAKTPAFPLKKFLDKLFSSTLKLILINIHYILLNTAAHLLINLKIPEHKRR
jgi:hypothetical protein